MLRYCLTIFLSAFLLFLIQPLIARAILPWYGGTAAVWTACMMFFQVTLVLGYAYADALRRWMSPRQSWLLHAAMLGTASALVSVHPAETQTPGGEDSLTWSIVLLLSSTIGLSFFALASTGPLLQAWQSASHPDKSPWRLYALSNAASLLALPSYPFLVEPFVPFAEQALWWRIGFWGFAILCLLTGWQVFHLHEWQAGEVSKDTLVDRTSPSIQLVWFLFPMTSSIVLLATTNLMCQEIAAVPFLWILPLTLYLLSLIVCFERPSLYHRGVFAGLLIVACFTGIVLLHLHVFAGLLLQIAGMSLVCFAASMVCHGELVRLRPATTKLTGFYLKVAIGGALGGIFVAVAAPRWFDGFYEFHLGLLLTLAVPLFVAWLKPNESQDRNESSVLKLGVWTAGSTLAAAFVLSSLMFLASPASRPGIVFQGRNEYGLVSVIDKDQDRLFMHGRIEHGSQSLDPEKAQNPAGYYVPESGAGLAIRAMREVRQDDSTSGAGLKIGVVGLGAGALMAWAEPEDDVTFYELSPLVADVAKRHFSYLSDSPGRSRVILGDGRVQLKRQLEEAGSCQYDLLFMDAFSSDSIPVHLLTGECFDLYFDHLQPGGILIGHITNRFIDLRPVMLHATSSRGIEPLLIDYRSDDGDKETRWVLMTRNEDVLQLPWLRELSSTWDTAIKPVEWTDDFASLTPLIDWSAAIDWDRLKQSR